MGGVLDPHVSPPIGAANRRKSGLPGMGCTGLHSLLGSGGGGNILNTMGRQGGGGAHQGLSRGFHSNGESQCAVKSGARSCFHLYGASHSEPGRCCISALRCNAIQQCHMQAPDGAVVLLKRVRRVGLDTAS
jgi:hypothetical protein